MKPITILAIDTSADETSAAITHGSTVLANVVASQVELHKPYGGVFPTVAKQAHKENIDRVIALAVKRAFSAGESNPWTHIDAIAVTQGPGLAPALEVGITRAKQLATEHHKPLYAVNHIEAHALSSVVQAKSKRAADNAPLLEDLPATFPTLALVVSGGHTEFILVRNIGEYQRLGHTIDDAAGECLDKVGRMIDLGYPAGPAIEQFAKLGDENTFNFPLPMTSSGDYNLSYSGLKTFARNLIADLKESKSLNKQTTYDLAASLQYGVFRHITHKLEKILKDFPDIPEVWLGGGVAANAELRKTLRSTLAKESGRRKKLGMQSDANSLKPLMLKTPYSKKLCGDNAAMIGVTAFLRSQYGNQKPIANFEKLDRKPRWGVGIYRSTS